MAYEAYIDRTYYAETYQGTDIDTNIFDRIALRASDEVDKFTFRRVRRAGLTNFDDDMQAAIQLATCAIAEALAQIDVATDSTGMIAASEKIGSYSYTADASSLDKLLAKAKNKAMSYLLFTGLLYRGI